MGDGSSEEGSGRTLDWHIKCYDDKKTEIARLSQEMTERAKRREQESKAFEELMMYQDKVFLICLGFSKNATDAEDLAQEVYLKAYRKIGSLKELRFAKLWLLRITRNTCLDYRKKQRIKPMFQPLDTETSIENNTPESKMIFQEQVGLLKKAIQRLPKKLKEVFILREYGDLSYEEIAATLEIKEGTIMSRLNRARQALLSQIKGEEK